MYDRDFSSQFDALADEIETYRPDKPTSRGLRAVLDLCKALLDFRDNLSERLEFLESQPPAGEWPDTARSDWKRDRRAMLGQFGRHERPMAVVTWRGNQLQEWLAFYHSTGYAAEFQKRIEGLHQQVLAAECVECDESPLMQNVGLGFDVNDTIDYLIDLAHMLKDSRKPLPPNSGPTDLIPTAVAIKDFAVSRRTLARRVKDETLHDYRRNGAPDNSPLLLSRAELAQHFQRKR